MRLSDTQKRIVAIIHRDGAIKFDVLVARISSGVSKSGSRQSIEKMIKSGNLLDFCGVLSLSAEVAAIAADMAEIERKKSEIEVATFRQNFSKGELDGLKMYANIIHKLRRDVHFLNAGAPMALPRSAEG